MDTKHRSVAPPAVSAVESGLLQIPSVSHYALPNSFPKTTRSPVRPDTTRTVVNCADAGTGSVLDLMVEASPVLVVNPPSAFSPHEI